MWMCNKLWKCLRRPKGRKVTSRWSWSSTWTTGTIEMGRRVWEETMGAIAIWITNLKMKLWHKPAIPVEEESTNLPNMLMWGKAISNSNNNSNNNSYNNNNLHCLLPSTPTQCSHPNNNSPPAQITPWKSQISSSLLLFPNLRRRQSVTTVVTIWWKRISIAQPSTLSSMTNQPRRDRGLINTAMPITPEWDTAICSTRGSNNNKQQHPTTTITTD